MLSQIVVVVVCIHKQWERERHTHTLTQENSCFIYVEVSAVVANKQHGTPCHTVKHICMHLGRFEIGRRRRRRKVL